jgi:hypothetical protein
MSCKRKNYYCPLTLSLTPCHFILLSLNLVPYPVSFHITVLDFSKNEDEIIPFFAAITISRFMLGSIYYINTVLTATHAASFPSVHATWGGCKFVGKTRYPRGEHSLVSCVTRSCSFCHVTFIKQALFVRGC